MTARFSNGSEEIRTSLTHPLRVAACRLPGQKGYIGLTICPGKKAPAVSGFRWERDLDSDIERLIRLDAHGVLTLMETEELEKCQVGCLGEKIRKRGLVWWHFPVQDVSVPEPERYPEWDRLRRELISFLNSGKNLVIHCRGGLGRSGVFAAVLLTELLGTDADEAMREVRQVRPGAIETSRQEAFVRDYRKYFPPVRISDIPMIDRIKGCLIGGAIGDAFGYPIEFQSLSQIVRKWGQEGLSDLLVSNGKALFSDDTQMTLFTLWGLLNAFREENPPRRDRVRSHIHRAYLDWLKTQKQKYSGQEDHPLLNLKELFEWRAPGNTCLSALFTGKCGSFEQPLNNSKGCGGVMRVAPIGLAHPFTPEEAFMIGADSAAITHGHPSGYWSAGALAMILRLLTEGHDLSDAIERSLAELQNHPATGETVRAITKASDLARKETADTGKEIGKTLGGGWTGEEALSIALFAAMKGGDFRDALRIAANHSGDSDSTASVTGQILGAMHGIGSIPKDWIRQVELSETVIGMAQTFSETLSKVSSSF